VLGSWDPLACGDQHRVSSELGSRGPCVPCAVSAQMTVGGSRFDAAIGTYRADLRVGARLAASGPSGREHNRLAPR